VVVGGLVVVVEESALGRRLADATATSVRMSVEVFISIFGAWN
jgi:hypothetical protein